MQLGREEGVEVSPNKKRRLRETKTATHDPRATMRDRVTREFLACSSQQRLEILIKIIKEGIDRDATREWDATSGLPAFSVRRVSL